MLNINESISQDAAIEREIERVCVVFTDKPAGLGLWFAADCEKRGQGSNSCQGCAQYVGPA
jgi:hypothetical protein